MTATELETVGKITSKFIDLGIDVKFTPPALAGPVVTLYKFRPSGRTRVSHLEQLAADLAVTLGVFDVLVQRRVGDTSVSLAVPNAQRKIVHFRDTVTHVQKLVNSNAVAIPLNFGVDESGAPFVEDLATLPHLLIAGETGRGKSTLLHSIIGTIVYTMNSRTVQLVLSDTKGVEFPHFRDAPHLSFAPANSVEHTLKRMEWITDVVEQRLGVIGAASVRNIQQYNKLGLSQLPYIILVIDEVADLLLGPKRKDSPAAQAELLMSKIVQKARAAGVHMIAATQRPSVDVITGIIKANFPARLAFRTTSSTDSRVILDEVGAEHLLDKGDMLYRSPTRPGTIRLHAPYTPIEDVVAAVGYAKWRELATQSGVSWPMP